MKAPNNVGGQTKLLFGNVPNDGAAATITGAAIDRLGYESATLRVGTGVTTGSPASKTINCKLTECDTSGGVYSDVSGAACTQITADSTEQEVDVDLRGCKRYLKVVTVVAFVDGSSPKCPVASVLVLGGAAVEPAT